MGTEAFEEQMAGKLGCLEEFSMNISKNNISEENRNDIQQLCSNKKITNLFLYG